MLFTVVTIVALAAIALLTRWLGGSWIFPPSLWAAAWGAFCMATLVTRYGDHELTPASMVVFLVGAASFGFGGVAALVVASYARGGDGAEPAWVSRRRKHFIQLVIALFSLTLLSLVPPFIGSIRAAATDLQIEQFAVGARSVFSSETARSQVARIYLSLTSIGGILAYIAAWLHEGGWRDRVITTLAVLVPTVMNVLTFARTPTFTLLVGVVGILLVRGRLRGRGATVVVVATAAVGLTMGALLGKGPAWDRLGPVMAIVDYLGGYVAGGPVGFAFVMDQPEAVGERGISLRFFTQIVSSLGVPVALPDNVLGYSSPYLGNVYTFYFAYWRDARWLGVIAVAFLAGLACTLTYVLARRGHPVAGVAMGLVFPSLVNAATGDLLFGSSVPWVLIVALTLALWKFPLPGGDGRIAPGAVVS